MADIFLSYSKKDHEVAQRFADTFEAHGWSVWWDTEIDAGEKWVTVIESALKEAKCVVVLWSENSAESRWVNKEARYGLERAELVPVLIEDVSVPFEFEDVQATRLIGGPKEGDATLARLLDRIGGLVGSHQRGVREAEATPPESSASSPAEAVMEEHSTSGSAPLPPRSTGSARRSAPRTSKAPMIVGVLLTGIVAVVGLQSMGVFGGREAQIVVPPPAEVDSEVNDGAMSGRGGTEANAASGGTTSAVTPVIEVFEGAPLTLTAGESIEVRWSIANATRAELDGVEVRLEDGAYVPVTSTRDVTLVAYNADGVSVQQSIRVTVTAPPTTPTVADATLIQYVADMSSSDRQTRMQATHQMETNYGDDPAGIAAVLATLEASTIDHLSPPALVNALYYLARTSDDAWSPDLIGAARAVIHDLGERRQRGMLGDQAYAEMQRLEARLDAIG